MQIFVQLSSARLKLACNNTKILSTISYLVVVIMPRSFLVKRHGLKEEETEQTKSIKIIETSEKSLEYAITLLALSKSKQWTWDYELEKSYWFETTSNERFSSLLNLKTENRQSETDKDIISTVNALTTLKDSRKLNFQEELVDSKHDSTSSDHVFQPAEKLLTTLNESRLVYPPEKILTSLKDDRANIKENKENGFQVSSVIDWKFFESPFEKTSPPSSSDQSEASLQRYSSNEIDHFEETHDISVIEEETNHKAIQQFLINNPIALDEISMETRLSKEDIQAFVDGHDALSRDNKRKLYSWYVTKISKPKNDDESYACNKCGKIFTYRSYLERHIKYVCPDSTGRTWKCSFCGKAFQYPCYLRRHIRSHTGESPYKCEKCGRAFVRSTDLQRHIRNHTGEKPYRCTQCARAFARSTDLKRHMRTHTGEKPYKCWKCGKSFSQSGSLQTHLHTHDKSTIPRNAKKSI